MSVECLQIRPGPRPLMHFTGEEVTEWCSRARGTAVWNSGAGAPSTPSQCRAAEETAGPAWGWGGGGPFASVPRTETSPGLKGQIRFLPLDSTSLVWKSSEEVVIFSKGIWFRAYVIKPESTCFSPRSPIPAFFPPPTPIFFSFQLPPLFLDERSNLSGR